MVADKGQHHSYAEQLAFIGLSDDSFDDGIALWAIIEPEISDILADFYAHLEQFAPEPMFSGIDISKLSEFQKQHWKRLFTTFFSKEYVDAARKIALAHDNIGLSAEWYIGGYVFFLNRMTDLVMAHFAGKDDDAREAVKLLNRLIGLDMGTVMSVYQSE